MSFLDRFRKAPAQETAPRGGFFTTDGLSIDTGERMDPDQIMAKSIQKQGPALATGQDGAGQAVATQDSWNVASKMGAIQNTLPENQMLWYASQGFIGFQMCAIIAQQWLVKKACEMPARDAVRTGYEIAVTDGQSVDPKTLADIKKIDKRMKIKKSMVEFVTMGRTFGIRIAIFKVRSDDPKYYEKPFNPDGVKPGSYEGIAQVDPYWCTPVLDALGTAAPASINFYEPTWWNIQGVMYHKSHLCIFKGPEVADILKPTYQYAGLSIPQIIFERVYAAERTANEAPMLAMTKRLTTLTIDMEAAIANEEVFKERMALWAALRDNHGVRILGGEETMSQLDTSLADLDEVIMTQYQIVCAIANVPATKILGTTPKGFNSTGEYEEANYHEELESLQEHDLSNFLNRHHQLVILSEIQGKPFETEVVWNPLATQTAKEWAETNKIKAETDGILADKGAISGQDIRDRLIADPNSGYNGLSAEAPDLEEIDLDEEADPDNVDDPADAEEK